MSGRLRPLSASGFASPQASILPWGLVQRSSGKKGCSRWRGCSGPKVNYDNSRQTHSALWLCSAPRIVSIKLKSACELRQFLRKELRGTNFPEMGSASRCRARLRKSSFSQTRSCRFRLLFSNCAHFRHDLVFKVVTTVFVMTKTNRVLETPGVCDCPLSWSPPLPISELGVPSHDENGDR